MCAALSMGEGSDNQTVCTQWGQPELCGGLHLPPTGTTRKRALAGSHEESLRANPRTQARRLRFSKLGGLENPSKSTSPGEVLTGGLPGGAAFQINAGEGGPWSSRPANRERRHPGA